MALPTIVGVGATSGSAGALTLALPSGVQENDILVAIVETENQACSISEYTHAPDSPISNGTTRLNVLWKRATASETDPATNDSGDHQVGGIIAIRGCWRTGSPFNVTASGTGTGTAVSIPTDTTTETDCLVLLGVATDRDGNSTAQFSGETNANLGSLTERMDRTVNTGGGGGVGCWTGTKASVGSYGATSVTQATNSDYAAWSGALRPHREVLTASATSFGLTGIAAELTTTAQEPPRVIGVSEHRLVMWVMGEAAVKYPAVERLQDDIIFLFIGSGNSTEAVDSAKSPGWTQVTGSPSSYTTGDGTRLTVYYKRVLFDGDGKDIDGKDRVWINTGSNLYMAHTMLVRGAKRDGNPVDVSSASNGTGTSITLAGATTTEDAQLILVGMTTAVNNVQDLDEYFTSVTNTDLGTIDRLKSLVYNYFSTAGGGITTYSAVKPTAGSYGNTTMTQPTSVGWAGMTIAVKSQPKLPLAFKQGKFSVTGNRAKLTSSVRKAIPWVAGAGESVFTKTGSLTIPIPVVAQEGDLLFAIVTKNDTAASNASLDTSGWTAVSNSPMSNSSNQWQSASLFWKRCDVNEPSLVVSSNGFEKSGYIIAIRDAQVNTNPFNAVAKGATGNGTLMNITGVTTTVANTLVIMGILNSTINEAQYNTNSTLDGNLTYIKNPDLPGWSQYPEINNTDPLYTNQPMSWISMWDTKATAGSAGTPRFTVDNFADIMGFMGAIMPPQSIRLDAHIGQFNVVGKEAGLSIDVPGEEMPVDMGNFTHSGAAAFLTIQRKLQAEQVLLSHNGVDALLIASRRLTEDDGDYSVDGLAATFKIGRVLNAESGSFNYSGQPADFFYQEQGDYAMVGGIGTFNNAGQNAILAASHLPLTAEIGNFTHTGLAASLRRQVASLAANGGLFSLDGLTNFLEKGFNMEAEVGVFDVVGLPAFFTRVYNAGQFTLTGEPAVITRTYKLVADPGVFEVLAETPLLFATTRPSWQIRCIVDLYPIVVSGLDHEHGGRLTVNATDVPIKSWTFDEPDNEITGTLNVVLARNNDRNLFTKDVAIKFESVDNLGGTPVWTTLFESGRIRSHVYTQASDDDGMPNNAVQFVGVPPMAAKLDIAPLDNEVYYNPDAHELDPNDFELIPDESGNNIVTILHPISQMGLHELFEAVFVDICGFAGVETSLPNIKINRLDLPPGQSAAEAVLSLVPMYKPDASTVGDVIWIRDGTALYSSGMPAPRQLQNTYLSNSAISTEYKRLRGIIVQYAQKGLDFDEFTFDVQSSGNVWVGPKRGTRYWPRVHRVQCRAEGQMATP